MIAILLIVFAAKVTVGSSIVMLNSLPPIQVFVGQGLSVQTSLVTSNSPVELACVHACLNYNSKFNSPCYAAQFIASTRQCLLQVGCTTVQLTSNLTSKTYPMNTSTIQQSNLILPLTTACSTSLTAQYGVGNFTVTHTGTTTTTSSNVTSINAAITYPTSPTSYTMVNDTSQSGAVNVLAGDFTISLAYKYTTPPASCTSDPLLTFLGTASGSQCMSIVTGCCGNCPQMLYWSSCSCVNPPAQAIGGASTSNYNSPNVNNNYWTHVTFVYKLSEQKLQIFTNGTLQTTATSVTFSPAVSQYRVMVGAVECYYGWRMQFPGSIACVTVSTAAFGNQDVLSLYKQCLQQQPVFFK